MYRKKKKARKLILIGCILFVSFFLLFYSLSSSRKLGPVESVLKDGATLISKVFMAPFTSLNGEKGEDASKSYTIQKNLNVHLQEEIEELRKTLELNKTLTDYSVVNATVLNRNRSYWYQILTIDKGKKAGLKENMVAITKDGLIGKLEQVTAYSATVKLITANDVNHKVSVSIATGEEEAHAILSGYDKEKDVVLITGIDNNVELHEGDVVTTSGLGGMFPRGIYIGVVKSIEEDKYGISRTIGVKTAQDFNKIHYVTVLKERSKK